MLLQHVALDVIAPDRQALFESELHQVIHDWDFEPVPLALVAPKRHQRAVRQAEPLVQVAQHHGPAVWRRQRGHQQAVVTARDNARDRAGR